MVYLSREVNGNFEIEKWFSNDKGHAWNVTSITKDSNSLNVRPVVPGGHADTKEQVLWMSGNYEHYTKFGTAIKLLRINP